MLKNASHFWHAKNLRFLDTPDTEEDEQNLVDKTIWCRDYFHKIGAAPTFGTEPINFGLFD